MAIIFLLLLHLAALSVCGAEPSNGSEFQPGLLAEYRSLTNNPAVLPVRRIDAKPSFTSGGMTPHPRLPPGHFSVTWTGRIDVDGDEPIRFGAFLSGELMVLVDGEEVLRTRNREKDAWQESRNPLSRAAGTFPIKIVFSSVEGSAARLQLWWSGRSFSSEPIPAYRFTHPATAFTVEWRLDAQRERGRMMAGQFGCARCHREAFPGIEDPPPGPSLKGLGDRMSKKCLRDWLDNPQKFVPHARMPSLFSSGREGFIERFVVAEYLLKEMAAGETVRNQPGDHRAGRQSF